MCWRCLHNAHTRMQTMRGISNFEFNKFEESNVNFGIPYIAISKWTIQKKIINCSQSNSFLVVMIELSLSSSTKINDRNKNSMEDLQTSTRLQKLRGGCTQAGSHTLPALIYCNVIVKLYFLRGRDSRNLNFTFIFVYMINNFDSILKGVPLS